MARILRGKHTRIAVLLLGSFITFDDAVLTKNFDNFLYFIFNFFLSCAQCQERYLELRFDAKFMLVGNCIRNLYD